MFMLSWEVCNNRISTQYKLENTFMSLLIIPTTAVVYCNHMPSSQRAAVAVAMDQRAVSTNAYITDLCIPWYASLQILMHRSPMII